MICRNHKIGHWIISLFNKIIPVFILLILIVMSKAYDFIELDLDGEVESEK